MTIAACFAKLPVYKHARKLDCKAADSQSVFRGTKPKVPQGMCKYLEMSSILFHL